jgi:hypothetical protein
MSRLLPFVLFAAWPVIDLSPPIVTAGEPTPKEKIERRLADLRKLSDTDLFARYDTAAYDGSLAAEEKVTRENVLVEVIRRGGPAAEKWLRTKMEADYERKLKEKEKRDALEARHNADPKNEALRDDFRERERTMRRLEDNLAIFTALRRVQKKPDPLTVTVELPKEFIATIRELPTLGVKVTNTDPEKLPLWFQFGGDTRPGRPARWRLETLDQKGKELPPLVWRAAMGGGIFREGTLSGGQSWEGQLPMHRFVRIREPGEYIIRAFYHNKVTIAEEDDISGLIVFESKPFKLKVVSKKIVILQSGDRKRARTAIAALDDKGPVRIVIGGYKPDYYSFIPLDSPVGQLHDLGWRAVPSLLDALGDQKLTPGRRAWLLGLLFGITRDEELNPFEFVEGRTRVLGAFETKGFFGDFSGPDGKLDVEHQKKLAEQWRKFRDEYLDVRDEK